MYHEKSKKNHEPKITRNTLLNVKLHVSLVYCVVWHWHLKLKRIVFLFFNEYFHGNSFVVASAAVAFFPVYFRIETLSNRNRERVEVYSTPSMRVWMFCINTIVNLSSYSDCVHLFWFFICLFWIFFFFFSYYSNFSLPLPFNGTLFFCLLLLLHKMFDKYFIRSMTRSKMAFFSSTTTSINSDIINYVLLTIMCTSHW